MGSGVGDSDLPSGLWTPLQQASILYSRHNFRQENVPRKCQCPCTLRPTVDHKGPILSSATVNISSLDLSSMVDQGGHISRGLVADGKASSTQLCVPFPLTLYVHAVSTTNITLGNFMFVYGGVCVRALPLAWPLPCVSKAS